MCLNEKEKQQNVSGQKQEKRKIKYDIRGQYIISFSFIICCHHLNTGTQGLARVKGGLARVDIKKKVI